MNTPNDKKKRPWGLKILIVIVALLALGTASAFGPMAMTSDGTENYSGVKLKAAQNVLDFDRGSYSPALFSSLTKAHIDSVAPSVQGKDSQGNPLRCTDDPNLIQYYSVTVRRIWIFGTTYAKTEYRVCNTAG
jgi:hypothetical protein